MKLRSKASPTLDKVLLYVRNNRQPIQIANTFFTYFEERHWKKKGKSMVNIWQEELDRWMAEEKRKVAREGY